MKFLFIILICVVIYSVGCVAAYIASKKFIYQPLHEGPFTEYITSLIVMCSWIGFVSIFLALAVEKVKLFIDKHT